MKSDMEEYLKEIVDTIKNSKDQSELQETINILLNLIPTPGVQ